MRFLQFCKHFALIICFFGFSAFTIHAHGEDQTPCSDALTSPDLSLEWIASQIHKINDLPNSAKRLHAAVRNAGMQSVALNEDILKAHNNEYTYVLNGQGVTDQGDTGRCVYFSHGSTMRAALLRSGLLPPDFEFSENYLWFYGLLEQANRYAETLIRNLGRKLSPREIQALAIPAVSEGAFFHSVDALVRKYGVIPKKQMNETASSEYGSVTEEVDLMLAQFALRFVEIRKQADALKREHKGKIPPAQRERLVTELRNQKAYAMEGVMRILSTHLGTPPAPTAPFKLRLTTKPDAVEPGAIAVRSESVEREFTALSLLEYTGYLKEDWISVAYLPNKKYGKRYSFNSDLEILPPEGQKRRRIEFFNLPIARLKQLTLQALLEGYPVSFSSDVTPALEPGTGILHPDIYKTDAIYGGAVNRSELLSSRQNLNYLLQSFATHQMTIVGVDQPGVAGGIDPNLDFVKLLIQNSWGAEYGDKGYLHAYGSWFEKFVGQISIPKRLLTPEELKQFESPEVQMHDDYDGLYR